MLRIRAAQWDAFQLEADSRLASKLVPRMRRAWPSQCRDVAETVILTRCEQGIFRGRELGFRSDRALARFVNLRFALGDRFPAPETPAAVIAILDDTTGDEHRRLDSVWAHLLGVDGRAGGY
jgi:hypothetical protein